MEKLKRWFYPGDMVTHTGEQEIRVFKSFSYYLANLANSNWNPCSDHTFSGFSCTVWQLWPSVSWWSQLTLFFVHACHFHIPWKVVKSYQVAHAFQFVEDWSHLLPGTMGVPSTFFNCRHGLTQSFISSTKFYVIWPLNYY